MLGGGIRFGSRGWEVARDWVAMALKSKRDFIAHKDARWGRDLAALGMTWSALERRRRSDDVAAIPPLRTSVLRSG
jgi:hypothetical protein